jgi:hypothetical protein
MAFGACISPVPTVTFWGGGVRACVPQVLWVSEGTLGVLFDTTPEKANVPTASACCGLPEASSAGAGGGLWGHVSQSDCKLIVAATHKCLYGTVGSPRHWHHAWHAKL